MPGAPLHRGVHQGRRGELQPGHSPSKRRNASVVSCGFRFVDCINQIFEESHCYLVLLTQPKPERQLQLHRFLPLVSLFSKALGHSLVNNYYQSTKVTSRTYLHMLSFNRRTYTHMYAHPKHTCIYVCRNILYVQYCLFLFLSFCPSLSFPPSSFLFFFLPEFRIYLFIYYF